MEKLHLLCNAHLDVVWQWQKDEAISAALSTFKAAADLCEEFDGFIFNHNESILYQWVEKYDNKLFKRIQRLVKEGKWQIIGGWVLQPDCNMPTGESIVRQILYGRRYFKEKFGVEPVTALNFDSFGHSQGMVQIMYDAGYKYYLFCRPGTEPHELPDIPYVFKWKGFDGESEIIANHFSGYGSGFGKAVECFDHYINNGPDKKIALKGWGVGNHGGGPSRLDLRSIREYMTQMNGKTEILHSTSEAFFEDYLNEEEAPEINQDLRTVFPGCYTSLIQIKQRHRELENSLITAEKMAATAHLLCGAPYPREDLQKAFDALTFVEFHDILPGTCTKPSEKAEIIEADFGLEIAARLKIDAFYALIANEKPANGYIPIFVFNPNSFEYEDVVECEFMMPDQNWALGEYTTADLYCNGELIPSQMIKEDITINLDWRKKIAFKAKLKPMSITRFDAKLLPPVTKTIHLTNDDSDFIIDNGEKHVVINRTTGLIDSYKVDGEEMLKANSFRIEVFDDIADPWLLGRNQIIDKLGEFKIMSVESAKKFAVVENDKFEAVNRIEEGDVFTRFEAYFEYESSFAKLEYSFPKTGTDFAVNVTMFNNERDKMLRMTVPTVMDNAVFSGQTMFGDRELYNDQTESVSQKWLMASQDSRSLILVNNGVYGSSNFGGEIRQSLMRSSGFCVHPLGDRSLHDNDRFIPRADQGEREFKFFVDAAIGTDAIKCAEKLACIKNEIPYAVNAFPYGEGSDFDGGAVVIDQDIRVDAFKLAEDGEGYIVRLFNYSDRSVDATLEIAKLGVTHKISFTHHKIKTLRIGFDGSVTENNILEEAR